MVNPRRFAVEGVDLLPEHAVVLVYASPQRDLLFDVFCFGYNICAPEDSAGRVFMTASTTLPFVKKKPSAPMTA